jgi:hypothetical protein
MDTKIELEYAVTLLLESLAPDQLGVKEIHSAVCNFCRCQGVSIPSEFEVTNSLADLKEAFYNPSNPGHAFVKSLWEVFITVLFSNEQFREHIHYGHPIDRLL